MKQISTEIIADSVNPGGDRITSMLLTYPRFIHSEFMTHRAFSRNAASSRAIPIEKVMDEVRTNPAMPIVWGKNGKGMQAHGNFTGEEASMSQSYWKLAARSAVISAGELELMGLHKQIVNRVLEPFVWMTTLVTGTEWENFFSLRVHKDAQPEFQYLAYQMLKAYLPNQPKKLEYGQWHIPFGDRMPEETVEGDRIKVAVARAARTSYLTMDGKIDVPKDLELHDRLASSGHWSPFEHVAQAMEGRHANLHGWKQYRRFFGNENRRVDLNQLLAEYEAQFVEAG